MGQNYPKTTRQRLLALLDGQFLEDQVANTKSAKKRIRTSERKRIRNRMIRSETRTGVKKARRLIESGELDAASEATAHALKLLDKAAQKGVIHQGNADRRKSRLVSALRKAQVEPTDM